MLSTRDDIEGMCPYDSEAIRDYAYQRRQRTSNLKHPMLEDDMISTFLKTLGLTYQLMFLTASTGKFTKVINKATCVQLAIKVGLVTKAGTVPPITSRTVPEKVTMTRPKSNTM